LEYQSFYSPQTQAVQPTHANCTAHACKPYSTRMEAVRHTAVGYKFNAFQSGLLSHDNRIYAGPLQ